MPDATIPTVENINRNKQSIIHDLHNAVIAARQGNVTRLELMLNDADAIFSILQDQLTTLCGEENK